MKSLFFKSVVVEFWGGGDGISDKGEGVGFSFFVGVFLVYVNGLSGVSFGWGESRLLIVKWGVFCLGGCKCNGLG